MSSVRTFRDLIVWREAIELAKKIYIVTEALPTREAYGLSAQMRRAAVSIPSNIAEGNARNSREESLQFLYVARGSLAELETQCILSETLQMVTATPAKLTNLLTETDRLLQGLIRSLKHPQIS